MGDGILQGSRDFQFEAFARRAGVGGAAVLILEQQPPDGALATAWDIRRRAERQAVFDVRRAVLSTRRLLDAGHAAGGAGG